jgi:histidine kinase
MNVTAVDDASVVSRFASLASDALRAVRWPQIRAAMFLGLALAAWTWTVFMAPISKIAETMPLGRILLGALIADQVKALCLVVAIVIADRAVDAGARRRRTYLLAALGGCVTGIVLTEPFNWLWRTYMLPDLWPANFEWLHGTRALFYWPIFSLTEWLLIGSGVVFLYADRRAARRTAQLLREAELDRIRRSRLALESRLQALQARVEPQFLFNTLDQVERLYERDVVLASVVRASKMLDDLIAYLRAAMPQMRDTSSTVAQEFELARAYLGIARLRLGERLRVDVRCPRELEAATLPPMMLLPLLDGALAHVGEHATATIQMTARRDGGSLAIDVRFTGAAALGGEPGVLNAIRERLAALYGDKATLTLFAQDAGTTEARLDLPFESAVAPVS